MFRLSQYKVLRDPHASTYDKRTTLDTLVAEVQVRRAILYSTAASIVQEHLDRVGEDCNVCAWSGRLILGEDYITTGNDDMVRQDIAHESGFVCDDCGETYHVDERTYVQADHVVCESCRDRNWLYCDDHEIYHRDDESCPRCEEEEDEGEGVDVEDIPYTPPPQNPRAGLMNYSTSPFDVFGRRFLSLPNEKLPFEPLWLGVELEVVRREDKWTSGLEYAVNTLGSFAIMKSDGSLESGGMEICSLPATHAWHMQGWETFLTDAHKHMSSWTKSCCGMHIHLSRAAITPLVLGRMIVFVNAPGNQEFIKSIAGRSLNSYCVTDPNKRLHNGADEASHHYEALSISERTGATVELRIFRGNVQKEGFLKNIDFAQALYEFCRQSGNGGTDHSAFLRWFVSPSVRKRFRYLDLYLQRKGHMKRFTREIAEQDGL